MKGFLTDNSLTEPNQQKNLKSEKNVQDSLSLSSPKKTQFSSFSFSFYSCSVLHQSSTFLVATCHHHLLSISSSLVVITSIYSFSSTKLFSSAVATVHVVVLTLCLSPCLDTLTIKLLISLLIHFILTIFYKQFPFSYHFLLFFFFLFSCQLSFLTS